MPFDLRTGSLVAALAASAEGPAGVTFARSADDGDRLSYAEVLDRARRGAARLVQAGVRPGDEVLLVSDDLAAFVTGFWACLIAQAPAVPVAVPTTPAHADKLLRIAGRLARPWLLTDADLQPALGRATITGEGAPELLERLAGRTLPLGIDDRTPPADLPDLVPQDAAFLQFSSGSTGAPKGVTVTHGNLLTNTTAIKRWIGDLDTPERLVNWMPLTHDFGIIFFHIMPVVFGCEHALLPTRLFLRNPVAWMDWAHRLRATVTGAPNYAYRHFLQRFDPNAGRDWDLSCLKAVCNGAEPISLDLARAFTDALVPFGLPATAITPAYGLAEGTLVVTGSPVDEPMGSIAVDRHRVGEGDRVRPLAGKDAVVFADCGTALSDVGLRIADAGGLPLADGTVGRVQIAGGSVTQGYWRDPAATEATFTADGYLDTGDLGLLQDGRLFLTGRRKDLIILDGVNYYPQDIEQVAARIDALDLNKVVACAVPHPGGEREALAVFVLHRTGLAAFAPIAQAVRDRVLADIGVTVDLVLPIARVPKTTSGKVQRYELVERYKAGAFDDALTALRQLTLPADTAARSALADKDPAALAAALVGLAATIRPDGTVAADTVLRDAGLTSQQLVALQARIRDALAVDIPVTALFDHPSLGALADGLIAGRIAIGGGPDPAEDRPAALGTAIRGIGLRLPGGAATLDDLADLLAERRDAVGPAPPSRWPDGFARGLATDRCGWLEEIDGFDARLFRLTPTEAEAVDPQQRLLLSVAWEALEDAGIAPDSLHGSRTGVFVGLSNSDYDQIHRAGGVEGMSAHGYTGTGGAVAAGRIAYVLGTHGPALTVDTACSSGLVALVEAMQAIRAGRCDRAIVAAANLILTEEMHAALTRMQALSPTGASRAFADAADGYARGEGAIAVVLERIGPDTDAGDRPLRAVLRGGAVNHDGASNGLTAPSGTAQALLIREALADAGVAPETVDAVEAHGTGTPLGDPIEVRALADVYGVARNPADPLPIGSVKSNLGHLEAAAGLAGLAKALVMLETGVCPASLHIDTRNRRVDWPAGRIEPTGRPRTLATRAGRPARVGLSAFGMSGTNAHVILEAPARTEPPAPSQGDTPAPVLLALSAGSAAALAATAVRWRAALSAPAAALTDLGFTAAAARAARPVRTAVIARSADDAAEALDAAPPCEAPAAAPPVIALFSGQGSQAAGVAGRLADRFPAFADSLAASDAVAGPLLGRSLATVLRDGDPATLARTEITQPAIVAIGIALAALYRSWGITPSIAAGHSVGEIAAAAALGHLDPASAIRFAVARGRAMQALPEPGALLAAGLSARAVEPHLAGIDPALDVAAINGPEAVTVGGPVPAIDALAARLAAEGVRVKRLDVSHAFHTSLVEPALPAIRAAAADLRPGERTAGALISAVTGRRIDPDGLLDPAYWVRHARDPVRWADALLALPEDAGAIAIDLGARPVAGATVGRVRPELTCLPSVPAMDPAAGPLAVAARLWERGLPVDLARTFDGVSPRIVHGPTTVFEGRVPVMRLPAGDGSAAAPASVGTVTPPRPATTRSPDRAGRTRERLLRILHGIAGLPPADVTADANWFSLGLDSLLIVQLQQGVNREFGLALQLADIYERGETLDRLSRLVSDGLPPEQPPAVAAVAEPAGDAPPPGVAALMTRQVEAMQALFAEQLAVLRGSGGAPASAAAVAPAGPVSAPDDRTGRPTVEIKGLFRQPDRASDRLTAAQKGHVTRLATAWNARSATSKTRTAEDRPVLANPRSVIGFRPDWKELTYPLHVDRAAGAHVWDLDGHRYVDITMGFGATLLGHNPPAVRDAVTEAVAAGAPIGPQSPLAGRVARGIARLTGVERVAFFTTGTEAVMVAVRLARAVTGRPKIVLFTDSYHGTFDGVLAVGWGDAAGTTTLPVTDGTPDAMVGDVIVLRYGDPTALEVIRRRGGEIAGVLVEPVQSRNPSLQPADFMRDLRMLTEQAGAALIFDEIITGFRIAPGGAQAHFGVRADIVTYGKVIGGGQPIGVVAGRRRFLDAVDGGTWAYGDASVPSTRTAFVAGTFNAHPLAMAAAGAMVDWLEREGPAALPALNARTEALCRRLDALFEAAGAPIRMARFGSLFRFEAAAGLEVLNYHLLTRGVFVWEGRNCFLSTAHTDADLDHIVTAVGAGLEALGADGWFGAEVQRPPAAAVAAVAVADTPVPMTRSQRELWVLHRTDPVADRAYHETVLLSVPGALTAERVSAALAATVDRHPMLRAGGFDGECWHRDTARPTLEAPAEPLSAEAIEDRLRALVAAPFDLDTGPPLRAALYRSAEGDAAVLALIAHHIAVDGWSLGLVAGDLAALIRDPGSPLPAPADPEAFAAWASAQRAEVATEAALPAPLPVLPLADPPAGGDSAAGVRLHVSEPAGTGLFGHVKAAGKVLGVSPVAVLLAGYAALIARLTGQDRFRIGIPVAGHIEAGLPGLVAMASTVAPLSIALGPDDGLAALAARCQTGLASLRSGTAARFAEDAEPPAVTALFNVDRGLRLDIGAGGPVRWVSAPIAATKLPLFLNVLELNDGAEWEFDVRAATADRATGQAWLDHLRALLTAAVAAPHSPLADLLPPPPGQPIRVRDGGGRAALPGVLGPIERLTDGCWTGTGAWGLARPDGTVRALGSIARYDRRGSRLIDRTAETAIPAAAADPVGPRTRIEAVVTEVWASVLGLPAAGVTANLFDLGGTSLKAVAILSRLRTLQGRAPSLAAFLEDPTVEGLARAVEAAVPPPPIPRLPTAEHYPAAGPQARLWFLEQRSPGLIAYNIPFRLDTAATLDPALVRDALTRLAERHESLRTALIDVDGEPRQRIDPTVMIDLTVEAMPDARAVDARAQALATRPIDLATAPLWRTGLLHRPGGSTLVLSVHHAIADVWSVEVMVRDLLALMRAEGTGAAPDLPTLPIQYRDAAAHGLDPALDAAATAHWSRALRDPPPPLDLPGAAARGPVRSHRGRVRHRALPAACVDRLRARATAGHGSLFAALLAGVGRTIAQATGRQDTVLATVAAGRDHPALANLIGFFVNTVPVRLRLGPGHADPVVQAAAGLRDAVGHGALPFDRIVAAAGMPWPPGRTPLCDVMVVLDERAALETTAAAHGFTVAEIDTPTSQFDLTLYVTERTDRLDLKLVFDADLFTDAAADALAETLLTGLGGGADDDDASEIGPASPHAARLWFVDQFENGKLYPAGPTYYTQALSTRLPAAPDPAGLRAALARLTAHHPILRTRLIARDDQPRVDIRPDGPAIPLTETTGDPDGSIAEAARIPFALDEAPLARALLIAEAGKTDRATLALVAHHAVADPARIARLLADLTRALADPAAPFGPPIRPDAPTTTLGDADGNWWRARMADLPALTLPTDWPRPAVHTFTAGRLSVAAPPSIARRLAAAEADRGVRRSDLIRAGFQALLARLSGQADIVIGEPVGAEDPARTIANPVPSRLRVDPGAGFDALVEASAAARREDVVRGAAPFDAVVLAVKPKNDMSRTALFDVMLVTDAPADQAVSGLGWGKYDLTLSVTGDRDALGLTLVYNRDLFAEASAAAILDRFVILLDGLLGEPGRAIGTLPLWRAGERDGIVARATTGLAGYPAAETIPGRFEAVADARRDAVAITAPDGRLTYGALDGWANRIAHRLATLGIGTGDRVGLLLDRGTALPAAMLGVLKAGAGYVPIDVDYPAERRRFMAEDAGIRAVLAEAGTRTAAHRLCDTVIAVDGLDDPPGPPSDRSPAPHDVASHDVAPHDVAPHDVAYVLYTSGSTGRPKGVMVTHGNVLQLLFGDGMPVAGGPDDVWSLFHSPCFDFSVWELYGALLTGGRVVMVDRDTARDTAAFRRLLADERVTMLSQTPSAFYALAEMDAEAGGPPLAVHTVVFGGEALHPARLADWHRRHPDMRLVNMYGITETTVHVTWAEIGAAEIADGRSVIGRPLPGYGTVILGPDGGLLPPGLVGEIGVTGHGVARGYLGRPELTAERFVDHPDLPGTRLYRSGDLGRIGPDGTLIYHGRLDDQVKVRGFRIELAEIERGLQTIVGIRAAVAAAAEGDRLVAYLVPEPGTAPPDRDALLAELRQHLPDHMIPARLTMVDRIPLTGNGKADRKRLLQEGGRELTGRTTTADATTAGPSPTADALAALWADVLALPEPPGPAANFFDLGGHSLLASRVVGRIRSRLGRRIDLRSFFAAPTLASLAAVVDAAPQVADAPAAPTAADTGPAPLSYPQRRLWLLQSRSPQATAYNMVGTVELIGPVDADALARGLDGLVARHAILRTRYRQQAGSPVQIVLPPAQSGVTLTRFDDADAAAADQVVAAAFAHAFDLAEDPPIRATLVGFADPMADGRRRHWLVLNLHHIASDGWSVTVMLRDWAALTRAAMTAGADTAPDTLVGAAALPALPFDYAGFARRQRHTVPQQTDPEAYWRGRLADWPTPLSLPTDRPRGAAAGQAGAMVYRTVSDATSAALRALARERGTTLFTVLAAVVAVQLHRQTGAADVPFGTPVAGREDEALEHQIGFYLNLLPLRARLTGSTTYTELIDRLSDETAGALAHQTYPFDRIVEVMDPPRLAGRHPLFDVLLILQNNAPPRLPLPGVEDRMLRDATVSAKLDLNYMIEDRPALDLALEVATDLYDLETAERLADGFVAIAEAMAAEPAARIGADEPPIPPSPATAALGAAGGPLSEDAW